MAYYAIQHTYGANIRDNDGYMIGTIVSFVTRRGRDAWVSEGEEYRNQPGSRDPLTVRGSATLRKAIRDGNVTPIKCFGA